MKRDQVIALIIAGVAQSEDGKAGREEVRLYVENRISRKAYSEAAQRGRALWLERVAKLPPVLVDTRDCEHAKHDGQRAYGFTVWTVRHPVQPTRDQLDAIGVPVSATYHSGSLEVGTGAQTWSYYGPTRVSAGTCPRCPAVPR